MQPFEVVHCGVECTGNMRRPVSLWRCARDPAHAAVGPEIAFELRSALRAAEKARPDCSGRWAGGSGGHRRHETCGKPADWWHPDDLYAYCDERMGERDEKAQYRRWGAAEKAPETTEKEDMTEKPDPTRWGVWCTPIHEKTTQWPEHWWGQFWSTTDRVPLGDAQEYDELGASAEAERQTRIDKDRAYRYEARPILTAAQTTEPAPPAGDGLTAAALAVIEQARNVSPIICGAARVLSDKIAEYDRLRAAAEKASTR